MTTTIPTRPEALRPAAASPSPARSPALTPPVAWPLSVVLSGVAATASLLTFAFGGVLSGTPVMNGSCRGTALVVLLGTVPVLLGAAWWARAHDSARATIVWFGAVLHLLYNGLLIVVGTPLNRFFLLYEAWVGLAVVTALVLAFHVDVAAIAARCRPSLPVRAFAGYLLVVVALNALAWLARIVPATVVDDRAADLLEGTGASMVSTYFQDLAFWLPLLAVGAVWLARRRPWGYLLGGAGLAMWALEGFTVAVDQWFGHRADPGSTVASGGAVAPFAVAGVVGVLVVWRYLRHIDP
jgi:hypothetical protein